MRLCRILVVDDSYLFLTVTEEFLAEQNFVGKILTTRSGQDALTLIPAQRPDLLIIDLIMPDMNGLVLTRLIKARWPEIPVIILTLHDSPQHRQAAQEAGADAFVPKVHMDDDLVPTLTRLLHV